MTNMKANYLIIIKRLFFVVAIIILGTIFIKLYNQYHKLSTNQSVVENTSISHQGSPDWMKTSRSDYSLRKYQTLAAITPSSHIENPTLNLTKTHTATLGTMRLSIDGKQEVYIPVGTFWMGSEASDQNVIRSEKPSHQVFLDAYWIDLTAVTNKAYGMCVNSGTCQYTLDKNHPDYYLYIDTGYSNFPVTYVTWEDALIFCAWAGGDLPTEAQWEKAARGPDRQIYPWGNNPSYPNQANVGNINPGPVPVGSFPAGKSYYGVLDMGGNVREWVFDWFGENYYREEINPNPEGPAIGEKRVLKGAAWNDPIKYSRAGNRLSHIPESAGGERGFRCVYSN
jgi:formylglycine-generating enzyme required for sulfatase activity